MGLKSVQRELNQLLREARRKHMDVIEFLRFDTKYYSLECNNVLQSSTTADPCSRLVVYPLKIQSLYSHVCKKKSTGPDGISKTFAAELTLAWCPVFSEVCRFSSGSCPLEKNLLLFPFQRNTVLQKTMITDLRIFVLKSEVNSELDPLQFAYRQRRSTDDVINTITYLTLKQG